MAEVAAIYWRLLGARVRADWQYRTSFVLFALGQAVITGLDFLGIAVIFGQVPQLAGWTLAEVAFLYGLSTVAFALAETFVGPVSYTARLIRDGSFDRVLVRPLNPIVQLAAEFFALRRLGVLAQASVVLGLAIAWLDLPWTTGRVLLAVATVASGTVIFGAIWVICSSIVFWTVDSAEVASAFTYGGHFLTQYPLSILERWLERVVTFVLPFGFVAYLPAVLILGKPAPDGLPRALGYAAPLAAAALVLVARGVWGTAIRHYRSTGS